MFFILWSYSELLSKFGEISFQEYVSKEIDYPVFYGDLVYKLRRVKSAENFVLSDSKIVKRSRRRKYDSLTIERTIVLVFGLSTAVYRSFLECCTMTSMAVGTIWPDLSKPPRRRLIVSRHSVSPWTWARLQTADSIAFSSGYHCIFYILCFITIEVWVLHFNSALVGC